MPKKSAPVVMLQGATEEQLAKYELRRKQLGNDLVSATITPTLNLLVIKYKTTAGHTVTVCYNHRGEYQGCGITDKNE